jgi:hypothetical protein
MRAAGLPNNPNKEKTESNPARINKAIWRSYFVRISGGGLNVVVTINITYCSYARNKTPLHKNSPGFQDTHISGFTELEQLYGIYQS